METKQLILLGPPGSGSRSQAAALAKQWQVPHIVAGGDHEASDEAMVKQLKKQFEQPDVMFKGWVLSGFPVRRSQAVALDDLLATFDLAGGRCCLYKSFDRDID